MDNTLQIWNVVGTWVASIGTVSAVITSLWLASNANKVKLIVFAGHRILISRLEKTNDDYCCIQVVNTGARPVKITNIGWQAGRFKNKQHMIQIFGTPNSDNVPKMLTEGEEAIFMVPFNLRGNDEDWLVSMAKTLTEKSNNINSLKVCVSTSVGQQFIVPVENSLKEKLLEQTKTNKSLKQDK
ncbi:hypothetical protein [Vibrio mangrovi]|uniref:Uncharacterized protein n=1 Tax=Vibrio mangrovi TaxID=474394 RepID=A0A1Y6IXG2_9VIBR|nr:hypothetical protein [Vibrio mangrovi]MDW6002835.1 hypothetical protein [Vibrio mangrovi]SMS02326.1 hypothetical protein VIM7927_03646 [Vibrio mangrovi]